MSYFKRKPKYCVKFLHYEFHYDTAEELARMVKESGCPMPNPYEPGHTEYDDYNAVMWGDM